MKSLGWSWAKKTKSSVPSQVGGLQLKDAKPLEGDLKKFMDSATEGAVLVSFGSSLKPDQMPPEKIQVFIDTFKQLGMKVAWAFCYVMLRYISFLQVIWKWDKEMPGLPDNILLRFDLYWKLSLKAHFSSSWLPQQDLLAHPNLKVRSKDNFAHSLSLEGFCHPRGSWQSCRGDLPQSCYCWNSTEVRPKKISTQRSNNLFFSNDQKPNLLRAERHGYAVSLDWDEMTGW